ncbi:MAG: C-GCAxxG-C-C family protein [Pseudomonadota bacterium]
MDARERYLQEVYEAAVDTEMNYYGCSQAVLAALRDKTGVVSDEVLKAGSALAAGVARRGETCGALLGAIMAIGSLMGREKLDDFDQYVKAMGPSNQVYERFREKIGHSICAEIQKIIFGRSFRVYIPEEREAFIEAGAHNRETCPEVCGVAARLAAEIIWDYQHDQDHSQ